MQAPLSNNALRVLQARYLRRGPDGHIVETPDDLFRRVARSVAAAEREDERHAAAVWEERFLEAMTRLEFLPNSPTLMNAGTPLGQLSACFVLPVGDSMEQIFDALALMARIQQSGGGTGFSFSRLRPRGEFVGSTGGTASGPVSFMRIFDCATENIRQRGKRRGANMGVLRIDHPDIVEFIEAKNDGQSFRNFNLSVAVTDGFLRSLETDGSVVLTHPTTGHPVKHVPAAELMQRIAEAAWKTGDPGLIFIDSINRANPTPAAGTIEATNPCGEVPLLPHEACNLGSINLSRMTRRAGSATAIDWQRLANVIRLGVRFLDNVIEVGHWPDVRIETCVRANRKIGLGVMGFAEMLVDLGVSYASADAVRIADELARFLDENTQAAGEELAKIRGSFPNWNHSVYARQGRPMRNATRLSIAPTGTISMIAGTSGGIEPLFALAYQRQHVLNGQTMLELNPIFLRSAESRGLNLGQIHSVLCRDGTLVGAPGVPAEIRNLFRTALEIAPQDHLNAQAAFQRHVDNAVSKTINLPHCASVETIRDTYREAGRMGLKGVTVYRYGSKDQQVLNLGFGETPEEREHFATCDPYACKL